jgi:hypothetical protein
MGVCVLGGCAGRSTWMVCRGVRLALMAVNALVLPGCVTGTGNATVRP